MSRTSFYKKLVGGIEISGATFDSSGTLGVVVMCGDKPMILTNAHVIGDPKDDDAKKKILGLMVMKIKAQAMKPPCGEELWQRILKENLTPVFQPKCAGGYSKDSRIVAVLSSRYEMLDAALCEIVDAEASTEIEAEPNFKIKGVVDPVKDMLVMKSGKKTGVTYGKITAITGNEFIISHVYDFLPKTPVSSPVVQPSLSSNEIIKKLEEGTLTICQTDISDEGDSGSIWVSIEKESFHSAVGLLYLGNNKGDKNYSVAKKMQVVKDVLKFDF